MSSQTISEFSPCAECSHDFYTAHLNAQGVCSDCFFGSVCCDAVLPDGVSVSFGTAIASCERCSYRCAYWECACELRHDCAEEDEED